MFQENAEAARVAKKKMESRLTWYVHVLGKPIKAPITDLIDCLCLDGRCCIRFTEGGKKIEIGQRKLRLR